MNKSADQGASPNSNPSPIQSSKFKNYLIEKLLNESPPMKLDTSTLLVQKSIEVDKEDQLSETGTYTIEESNLKLDNSTRASIIDETFGILNDKNNNILKMKQDDLSNINKDTNDASLDHKQSKRPLHAIRLRNLTYSLAKDVVLIDETVASSDSATSSSHSMNHDLDNSSKIKKTQTYDIIADQHPELGPEHPQTTGSSLNTSRTIATDVLLGDTDKLMQELKKRRFDKKSQFKAKILSLNTSNNTNDNLSSSSASSSSTNLSNDAHLLKSQCWMIPSGPMQESQEFNQNEALSTRATVNFDQNDDEDHTERTQIGSGSGGLAFEFILNKDRNRQSQTSDETSNSQYSSRTNNTITKGFELRSKQRKENFNDSVLRSSYSTTNSGLNTPKSLATSGVSLGAKIQSKAKENLVEGKRRGSESGPGIHQGAITASTSTPHQYINRTLYLRQQSAKAKRESMERTGLESSVEINQDSRTPGPKPAPVKSSRPASGGVGGILKKGSSETPRQSSVSSSSAVKVTGRQSVQQQEQKSSKRSTSSRATSPNRLMTNSLNLPSGASLPLNLHDSFQKRKNYDPLKSVELDKLKRQQNSAVKVSLDDHNHSLLVDDESLSESSSYTSLPYQQVDNTKQVIQVFLILIIVVLFVH